MQKNQNPITMDGSSKREQNRVNRANSMAQVDSNDMMSLKAMFMFLNEITNPNSQSFKEFKDEKAMKELIERTNKEFSISPEAASNFFKSEEFMKLNKHLIKPFDNKEIEAMSQEVLKKVGDSEISKILGVKGYFIDKIKDLVIDTIKANSKKDTNVESNSNDNVAADVVKNVVEEVATNKIHRNLNRNR